MVCEGGRTSISLATVLEGIVHHDHPRRLTKSSLGALLLLAEFEAGTTVYRQLHKPVSLIQACSSASLLTDRRSGM